MSSLQSLLPVLLLYGGLLLLLPLPGSSRYRSWIPLLANILAAGGLFAVARAATAPVTLFPPSDVLPALSLTIQWNGPALPFGLILLALTGARFLMGLGQDPPSFSVGALAAEAGALLFFASDNFIMVAAAWLLVELGLLLVPDGEQQGRERIVRAFAWNLAAIVVWLTAAMIIANESGALDWAELTLTGSGAFLAFLAIWIRSGLYPFQSAAPTNVTDAGVRLGLPLLLAGYLLVRFTLANQGALAAATEIQALALLATGISALVVLGQAHGPDAFTWHLRALAAPMLLLPFFIGARVAPPIAVWLALSSFVICHTVGLAGLWRSQAARVPLIALLWIAVLLQAAWLPLAPGFWSRIGLLGSAYGQGRLPVWLLLVAMLSLILVPVWRELFASRETAPREPTRPELAALVLLFVPTVILSVLPSLVLPFFPVAVTQGAATAYEYMTRPTGLGPLIFLMAGFVVPVLASFELARRWDRRAALLPPRLIRFLDLDGPLQFLDHIYRIVRSLIQQSLSILEQPPIAWLIFAAIWVAIWLRGLSS